MAKVGTTITKGYGITLTVGGTQFGQIIDCPFPSVDSSNIDTSSHDSDWASSISGTKSIEDLTVRVKYDKALYTSMLAVVGGTNTTITIGLPAPVGSTTTGSWACSGHVKGLPGQAITKDDDIEHDVVLTFTGQPTAS